MTKRSFFYIVNNLQVGGAERVLANFLSVQTGDAEIDQLVVILTQPGPEDARAWFRDVDCRVVDVAEFSPEADVVATFLQMLDVAGVCVINSALGWELIESHGHALRRRLRLSACAFCYDYDQYGRRGGYAWTNLPFAIHNLDVVITDNTTFTETLRTDLRLSEQDFAKFLVIRQPVPASNGRYGVSGGVAPRRSRPTILWASRFARQKRLNLALEVAALLPEMDLLVAGEGADVPGHDDREVPENVHLLGPFRRFSDLPASECAAFLYTAEWDGLPNVLLEAGSLGLPIVAADVGGVAELVNDGTGWLVAEHADPSAYARALRTLEAEPEETVRRVRGMLVHLNSQHDGGVLGETLKLLRTPMGAEA